MQGTTLLTPNDSGAYTTLQQLAARAPAKGSHIQNFPELPVDAPDWNGRVEYILKIKDCNCCQITDTMIKLCRE
jgi:hypothetical protein